MKTFYITVENISGTPYDFEVEASGPEDVMGQIRALSAGLRMGLAAEHGSAPLAALVDGFVLVDLSTSKTRKREYIKLSEWIRT